MGSKNSAADGCFSGAKLSIETLMKQFQLVVLQKKQLIINFDHTKTQLFLISVKKVSFGKIKFFK